MRNFWKPNHSSNENTDPAGKKGHPFWGWRAWWYGPEPKSELRMRVEWYAGRKATQCMLEYSRDHCEAEQSIAVGIPWVFGVYLTTSIKRTSRYDRQSFGLRVFDRAIWWEWNASDDWHSGQPWWQEFCIRPLDLLFGSTRYSSVDLSTHTHEVPLPEGGLPVEITMSFRTWKRPRLPWRSASGTYANVEVLPGREATVPGKGENAWDLEDSAIESLSCPARTPEEAIAAFVESVLRTRMKYGNSHECPTE